MRLNEKVSIITGAGSGMGRVAALRFAAEGSSVVVADTQKASAEETVRQIRAAGGEATAITVDVSVEADAKAMVDVAIEKFGRLDVLYNNAGIMPQADHSVVDTPVEIWDQVMAVNVRGVYLACKYAIPRMLENKRGSIINVSSFVAVLGCSVPQDAYTDSNNAILPGPVETPLLMEWLVKDEQAKKIRLARNPSGRFGKPDEVVSMAVYLASDESAWTNGASLIIDGGISVNYF